MGAKYLRINLWRRPSFFVFSLPAAFPSEKINNNYWKSVMLGLIHTRPPGGIWKRRFHPDLPSAPREGNLNWRNNHRSFWICDWEKLGQENHMTSWRHRFRKDLLQNVFGSHENKKLKSVFEKLRFRDGLEWTVRLKIKLHFHISPA